MKSLEDEIIIMLRDLMHCDEELDHRSRIS